MSRQIIFRGKTLNTGEWVYGDLIRTQSRFGGRHHIIFVDGGDLEDESTEYAVDAHSVGQFTGLPDKAGRDIYEGDICRRGHLIGTVVYHKERAMFILKDTYGFNTALYEDGVLLEVIGNIYEHPELLTHVSPKS